MPVEAARLLVGQRIQISTIWIGLKAMAFPIDPDPTTK